MSDKPNVLFIVWDTVRFQNTSLNGYERSTTPELAKIAKESVNFTEARAPAPWTLPSHASIFTGLYPREHGTTSQNLIFNKPNRHLASQLSAAGYETSLFTSNTYLSTPTFKLTSGFDLVFSNPSSNILQEGIDPEAFAKIHGTGSYMEFVRSSLRHNHTMKSFLNGLWQKAADFDLVKINKNRTGDTTEHINSFFDWIDTTEDPFFGFLNLMDAHAPYRPPEQYEKFTEDDYNCIPQTPPWLYLSGKESVNNLSKLEALYDDCIRFLDSKLGEIYSRLEKNGALENTIVIITSDHGEAFGEQALVGQNRALYGHQQGVEECLLHVPLVIRFPEEKYAGETVDHLVSLKDLYYTIKNEAGLDTSNVENGILYPDAPLPEWVLGEWYGFTENARQSAKESGVNLDLYDNEMYAYYENSSPESIKYAKVNDGREQAWTVKMDSIVDDLSQSQIASLRSRASKRLSSLIRNGYEEQTVELSDETIEDLEQLGYL